MPKHVVSTELVNQMGWEKLLNFLCEQDGIGTSNIDRTLSITSTWYDHETQTNYLEVVTSERKLVNRA